MLWMKRDSSKHTTNRYKDKKENMYLTNKDLKKVGNYRAIHFDSQDLGGVAVVAYLRSLFEMADLQLPWGRLGYNGHQTT